MIVDGGSSQLTFVNLQISRFVCPPSRPDLRKDALVKRMTSPYLRSVGRRFVI